MGFALVAFPSKPVMSRAPADPSLYIFIMVRSLCGREKRHPVSHQVAIVVFLHLEDQLIHPKQRKYGSEWLGVKESMTFHDCPSEPIWRTYESQVFTNRFCLLVKTGFPSQKCGTSCSKRTNATVLNPHNYDPLCCMVDGSAIPLI